MAIPSVEKNKLLVAGIAGLLALVIATGLTEAQQTTSGKAQTQTFVTYRYSDPMTGMEAFRLLIPKSWRAEGAITWSTNPALPAQSRFRFYNPSGSEELNFFPTQAYFWTDNRLFLQTNPPGTFRFGTLVAQPIELHSAFTRVIIPYARKGVGGLSIIREKDVPELAKIAMGSPQPGVKSLAKAGKMRITYRDKDRQIEEEFYAAVSQFITPMPPSGLSGGYFINYWYLDYIFSFRADKGNLDPQSKLFQTMIYSVKMNPRWAAKVVNTKEILVQKAIRGIKEMGRIGEAVAKAGSSMREDQQRDWERRQAAKDKISQNFSDYIRGVDRYYDPHAGKEVELPSGYGHAWANNLGEYIVTDSPSYNPNVGSNLHWEPMKTAR